MTEVCGDRAVVPGGLHELFQSATHDASAAMCRWTGGLITVALDEVRLVPLEGIVAALEIGDDLLTMVVLSLQGEVGGTLILMFDDVNGRQLAASLLDREPDTQGPWSELEKSALAETGNILSCAYIKALSRWIGIDLIPSAPYFLQDYGASVLQQAAMAQAITSDQVLLCQIAFRRKDRQLDWRVVFIPTDQMQEAMRRSLHAGSEE